ncbi:MAG TPA: glutamine amidotransferase [Alphaproteobacteria bacterium]|nr:glutamine amidotransferase [Alphaproteobacteria bacterium]
MNEAVFVLLDEFADWELAPIASVINQFPNWTVKTAAPAKAALRSIGGISVVPDCTFGEISWSACKGVFLIGGNSWRTPAAASVKALVEKASEQNIVIGAICDATTFLASTGVLNTVRHTGNVLSDLELSNQYNGQGLYQNVPAVCDQNIITANGCAPLEFAREAVKALGILDSAEAEKWYKVFKQGFYDAPQEAFWWFGKMRKLKGCQSF